MLLTRQKYGRGFSYRFPDGERLNADNTQGRATKQWITRLAIPPAWTNVRIDLDQSAKIHAFGRDANGKKQYVYNPSWQAKRSAEKFARIQRFATQLSTMRRVTGQDLNAAEIGPDGPSRKQVLACMVRLIDSAYFRPGNAQYTAENESFGLTTLRSRHLTVKGDELVFDYQGKSGVAQVKRIEDQRLTKIVAELDDRPGYRIFKYVENGQRHYLNSEDLNAYIRDIMGEEFSAKDFRTWAGTALMAVALSEFDVCDNETQRDKNILEAIERVAQKLGNTPAVCRSSYIDARVINAYTDGTTMTHIKESISEELNNDFLSADEYAILRLLESTL